MKTLLIAGLVSLTTSTLLPAQSIDTLKGTLSTSRTLEAGNCYVLDGCFRILSGGSLTLPAGTVVRALPQASLIVHQGGQIFANGTSASPVVFTYAQKTGAGTPIEWDGLYVAGRAVTNQASPSINKTCPGTISYGGTNDADNSGTLQYVRIEYAGVAPSGDPEVAALNLLAIGTGTTIDHVQVTSSRKDAYEVRGGKVTLRYLEALNNYRGDMQISQGYTGNIQFLTAVRLDGNAHDNTGVFSNGIYVFNDATGTAATPRTHPVISNATFFGPKYCGASSIHSDFRAAVRLALNAEAEIYNSVFTGWNTGLQIVDNSTISNANVNGTIRMEYNTFFANTANFANSPANFDPTGTGCASTITDWMDGSLPCSQADNLVRTSLTGYSSTVCGNYCSTAPTMTLSGTNNVGAADYTWDAGSDFTHETYRGSLTAANWSASWSNWCPQSASYCSLAMRKAGAPGSLLFIPNPASAQTDVVFDTDVLGTAVVTLQDKVTGAVLRTAKAKIQAAGVQRIPLQCTGLREGVYPVKVRLSNGQVLGGQLIIR